MSKAQGIEKPKKRRGLIFIAGMLACVIAVGIDVSLLLFKAGDSSSKSANSITWIAISIIIALFMTGILCPFGRRA
jgi:hypothetical protein